jgi:hypothetical protein
MTDRVQPGALRFKDKAIYSKTKSIKEATREPRTVEGKPVKAVINRGPAVADIQKASGHEVKPVPVQEAHGRTHIPDTVTHKTTTARPEATPGRPAEQPRAGEQPKGKEEKREP